MLDGRQGWARAVTRMEDSMKSVKRVNILGCPFDAISFSDTVHSIKQAIMAGESLQIVPGNVDFVMKARRDPIYAQELWQADWWWRMASRSSGLPHCSETPFAAA